MADITPYFRFAGSGRGQKTLLSAGVKRGGEPSDVPLESTSLVL